ncbi:hypothetical protein [Fodinibius sediminis]|uniref:Flagellar biosynthesis GTPase FlhF n=1 Tax=Fodinibius sediminis TaxID=1214077 RepID=A0A521CHP9_9BACT|nr:hypothetical protein [Fodinibius sediminis]SMO58969.1 Flagellar biosynthesis GTPase FlhF [Fodinibius sediminis]
MIIKKFHGESIKDARQNAYEALGKDCVVLETTAEDADREATVSVLVNDERGSGGREAVHAAPDQEEGDFIPRSIRKVKKLITEGVVNQFKPEIAKAENSGPHNTGHETTPASPQEGPAAKLMESPGQSDETGLSFFEQQGHPGQIDPRPEVQGDVSTAATGEEKNLQQRLDRLEGIISAGSQYMSHPVYLRLTEAGVPASMTGLWFKEVAMKGIDPFSQSRSFAKELAGIVRNKLSRAQPEGPVGSNLLFMGPAGAGKSTLIMKLASNAGFSDGNRVAVVAIEPPDTFVPYSILKSFAIDRGLSCYSVKTRVDLEQLQDELSNYDRVLFDTPALPMDPGEGLSLFSDIRQIISSVHPLEIHFTVNATLEGSLLGEEYTADYLSESDCLALTHMDETPRRGAVVPLMAGSGCKIRYISEGRQPEAGIRRFDADRFAEEILPL